MESGKTVKVEKTGRVLSAGMDKSRTVMLEGRSQHSFYKKFVRSRKKVMVHDEANISREGDLVRIVQCRPLSKCKRWMVAEVIEKGESGENGTVDVGPDSSR